MLLACIIEMSVLNAKRVGADQTSRPAASDLLCDIFFPL